MLQLNDDETFLILACGMSLPKRKFQARKLVHENVDFVDQNAQNLTNEHL
jgi:hypothetical protein